MPEEMKAVDFLNRNKHNERYYPETLQRSISYVFILLSREG